MAQNGKNSQQIGDGALLHTITEPGTPTQHGERSSRRNAFATDDRSTRNWERQVIGQGYKHLI